jgi:hypothetical protein
MTLVKPEAVIRSHRRGFQAYRALEIRVAWVNEIERTTNKSMDSMQTAWLRRNVFQSCEVGRRRRPV